MAWSAISLLRLAMSVAGAIFMATLLPVRLSTPSLTTPEAPSPSFCPSSSLNSVVGSVVLSNTAARALSRLCSSRAFGGSGGWLCDPPSMWNLSTSSTAWGFFFTSTWEMPDTLSRASHSLGRPRRPLREDSSRDTCTSCLTAKGPDTSNGAPPPSPPLLPPLPEDAEALLPDADPPPLPPPPPRENRDEKKEPLGFVGVCFML